MDVDRFRLFQEPWPVEHRHFQLGFLVDDLVESAMQWADVHGIGPFHVLPRTRKTVTYLGQDAELDAQIAVAQAGPVQIELITQFDDAPSVYRDLAGDGSCRFHQLSTVTNDYDGTVGHFVELGYRVQCELFAGGQHVAYIDTRADFGFFTEVVENAPGFLDAVARIAETCATWDGTDPVRILTRDGYRTP